GEKMRGCRPDRSAGGRLDGYFHGSHAASRERITKLTTGPIPRPIARCPICSRPAVPASRPFCSPRCAEVDLGRWLTSQYVVPGPPAELDDDPPPTPDQRFSFCHRGG